MDVGLVAKEESEIARHQGHAKVLQCAFPKSGNYVVFRMVMPLLDQGGGYRSYVDRMGLGRVMAHILPDYMFYPLQSRRDIVHVKNGETCLTFPHPDLRSIPVSVQSLRDYSTYVATHEPPSTILEQPFADDFPCGVYIVRDGRDAVNSMIHWVTRPRVMQLHPEYECDDPDALYENAWYFERSVTHWRDHVRSYFKHQDRFMLIRYEHLLDDEKKRSVVEALAVRLGVDARPADIDRIIEETSVNQTKGEAPHHVRKAKRGDWTEKFTPEHKAIFKRVAGQELIQLGYESDLQW